VGIVFFYFINLEILIKFVRIYANISFIEVNMLECIRITNFALISQSSVEFGEGFNVLTGETGAGKSLIVDALVFLTGVRADKTFIKSGEEFSRVEGVFSIAEDNEGINEILSSIGLENEGTLIISRQFNISGKNECRVNGEIVTLNIIRKLSSHVLDIFGQNDSQILLDSNNHLNLLDSLFEDSLRGVKNNLFIQLNELHDINSAIKELGGLDKDRENSIDLLKFQISEIDNANLEIGEEENLKIQIKAMQNAEKIAASINVARESLSGEYSIDGAIKTAISALTSAEEYLDGAEDLNRRLASLRYEFQDITSTIESLSDSVVYDERELDRLEDRLMLINDLERKYGNSIEDVLSHRAKLNDRLQLLINADEELARLSSNKSNVLREILELCQQLRAVRTKEIEKFSVKLESELKLLGMKNSRFVVEFKNDLNIDVIESQVNPDGADEVEFLFSANLGVEPRPLAQIISGGEMSRFMLAFKSIMNSDNNKTCIFDEIDTGIGGEIGGVVGEKICQISRTNQVICITHLAQIASFGDINFKIEKYDENNMTVTSVRRLDEDSKVQEIARMLSGNNSETSINHARELITMARGFKSYSN